MTSLEVLHLDNNQITGFPSNTDGWTNMKTLTASENSIRGSCFYYIILIFSIEIPAEAMSWISLVYLNLRKNAIEQLPVLVLKNWTKIERLYISINRIREIPDEIGHCQRLVELDFSSNLLESVPVGLAMCINLNLLNLGANKIAVLPPDIFTALIQLRELQLYKNKLTALPPEIGNLKGTGDIYMKLIFTALRRLSVSSNNLKALPEEIGACSSLRELYINNNAKFSVIPGSAGHLR